MITLATLPQATAQEVFDQVKNHLLTQKKQSLYGGICAYRGENGKKCAAGCLISDDEFKDDFNSYDWYQLISDGIAPRAHVSLIAELLGIHDGTVPEHWEEELKEIALLYKLNY